MLKNYQKESKLRTQQGSKRVLHTNVVSDKSKEQRDLDHINLRTEKQQNNKQTTIDQNKNPEKTQQKSSKHQQIQHYQQQNNKKKKNKIRVQSNFNTIADIGLDSAQNNSVSEEDIQNASQLNIDNQEIESLPSEDNAKYRRTKNVNNIQNQNYHKKYKNEKMNRFNQFNKKHNVNNLFKTKELYNDKLTQKISIEEYTDQKNNKNPISIPKYQNQHKIETVKKYSPKKMNSQLNSISDLQNIQNKQNIQIKPKFQNQNKGIKIQPQQFIQMNLSVDNRKPISNQLPNKSINYKQKQMKGNYSSNQKLMNTPKRLLPKNNSKFFKDFEDKIQTQETLQSNIQLFKDQILYIEQKLKKNKQQKNKINEFKQRLFQKLIISQSLIKKPKKLPSIQKKKKKKKVNKQKIAQNQQSLKQKQKQIQILPQKIIQNSIIKQKKQTVIIYSQQQKHIQDKQIPNHVAKQQINVQTERNFIQTTKKQEQKEAKSIRKTDTKEKKNKHVSFQMPNQEIQSDCISFLKKLCCL